MSAKTKNKRAETVRNIIKQEGESLFDDLDPNKDAEFDPTIDLPQSGPEHFSRTAQHRDELVIDELLASVPKNQGYYLKLYRNVGPNSYELKQRIDNYDTWTDLEWEVTSIVRHNTRLNPGKWGSGTYRIVVWRDGGIRAGAKYRPMEFHIDAQEPEGLDKKPEEPLNPMLLMQEQMSGMAQFMQAMSAFMPKQIDPAESQKQMAESFRQGLSASTTEASSTSSAMAMMMSTVVTMMSKMMETMASINKPAGPIESSEQALSRTIETLSRLNVIRPPDKPKNIIEQLGEMKALGFEPFKQSDPMAQVQQMKSLVSLVSDMAGVGGTGEKPSIIEKLIDALAPVLPTLLPSIKGLSDNYLQLQHTPRPAALPNPMVQTLEDRASHREYAAPPYESYPMGSIQGGAQPPQPQPNASGETMFGFFDNLKQAIVNNNTSFYPYLFNAMNQFGGAQTTQALANGQISPEMLVGQLRQLGGATCSAPELVAPSLTYAQGFIAWVQQVIRQQQQHQQKVDAHGAKNGNGTLTPTPKPNLYTQDEIVAACQTCGAEYVYDSVAQFQSENGTCEDIMSGTICGGRLKLTQGKL